MTVSGDRTGAPERGAFGSAGGGDGSGPAVDIPVLAPGSKARLLYRVLGLVALAGTVAFWLTWPPPFHRHHPYLYALATLATAYYVAVWFARWLALRNMRRPRHRPAEPGLRVGVATSFVPQLESIEMLEVTVRAMVALDYQHETWVLDEGDDPAVRDLCARLGANHFTRLGKPQYHSPDGRFASRSKHGNYNAWLDSTGFERYDVIATFDPDHVPERTYLTRLLGHFRDPRVAYVQAPQVYYNQRASFIARGAAEETYAYYSSHLMASYGLGHTVIIGSHSCHRVSALKAVGGFPAHDAEDLYLTMVYRAAGWLGVYVPEILALGTAPVDWPAYLRQQVRWSRAVLDLKRNVFPALFSRLSRMERLLNLFHGIYYLRPLILLVFYVVLVGMIVQNSLPSFINFHPLLGLAALTLLLAAIDRFRQGFFLDRDRERGFHWRALLLQAAKAPHLAVAVIDVAINRKVTYVTTPKAARVERPRRVLAAPHLSLGILIAIALGAGYLLHGPIDRVLVVAALLFLGTSLGLAWTELWSYPPGFQKSLLVERRREMGALLPPDPPESEVREPAARGTPVRSA
jgi:cellulose synthase (UDP-forming)